ncbi:GDSL-type esterase/lipase family protein [Niallia sp. 03133]|uniref:GDSL-type esterase/lipase family protein n=1 Tax=Niallia sp. 03133 TaxID=3458060 RepID=UPI004044F52C
MKNKPFKFIIILCFAFALVFFLWMFKIEKKPAASMSVYEKIKEKEDVHYLIIGDSIGRGSGASTKEGTWFHLLEKKIEKTYDVNLSRNSIVQSGATAFEGFYKFKHTPINEADLVFIVFGENDRKYMNEQQFATFYEQLLLQVKSRFPSAELITITESCLENDAFVNTITALSKNFQATNIDMRIPFEKSGYSAKQLTKDLVHPNDKGYKIYSREIFHVLNNKIKKNKPISSLAISPEKMNIYLFDTKFEYTKKDSSFVKKGSYYTTEKTGASIDYEFNGSYIGVNVIRSENGGMMDVYIDNKYRTTISTWWPFEKRRALYVASGLKEGHHKVSFRLTGKKSESNKSSHSIIQISSIIVNGK